MNWFLWLLVAIFVSDAVFTVSQVDKDREPMTPGVAAFMVLVYGSLVVGVLWTGGVFA